MPTQGKELMIGFVGNRNIINCEPVDLKALIAELNAAAFATESTATRQDESK